MPRLMVVKYCGAAPDTQLGAVRLELGELPPNLLSAARFKRVSLGGFCLVAGCCVGFLGLSCHKEQPLGAALAALSSAPVVNPPTQICVSDSARGAPPEFVLPLPSEAVPLCLDPHGQVRSFGETEKEPLEAICAELLSGECEAYQAYGLRKVTTLRYVDALGSPAAVRVHLSRFSTAEGALAYFTHRALGDRDPAHPLLVPLAAGSLAVSGAGVAYVWRAGHVLELSYSNQDEAPSQLRASGERLVPSLATLLGQQLRGDLALPESARRLPEGRLPLGLLYETRDALQVLGLGAGATGFYQDGNRRFRVFISVHPDASLARDMIRSLRRLPGLRTLKDDEDDAFELRTALAEGEPVTHWVVARRENVVVAAGDDAFALRGAKSLVEREAVSLDQPAKRKQVRSILSRVPRVPRVAK